MKSISLTLRAKPPGASIPLGYHHGIQGLIYNLLKDNRDFSDFLHESGYRSEDRKRYGLFTFGSLAGNHITRKTETGERYIYFPDFIRLEIRSASSILADCLIAAIQPGKTLRLYGCELDILAVDISSPWIEQEKIFISFSEAADSSPITLHQTDSQKRTIELEPSDPAFLTAADQNFKRKYQAYFGENPDSSICIELQSEAEKYVTHYKTDRSTGKRFYIAAWKGSFVLSGKPEHLTFLYYAGIGARNSAGFGMFRIKE